MRDPGQLAQSITPLTRVSHDPADRAARRNPHSTAPDRGFLPWRLSDAGPQPGPNPLARAGIRNPSQETEARLMPRSGRCDGLQSLLIVSEFHCEPGIEGLVGRSLRELAVIGHRNLRVGCQVQRQAGADCERIARDRRARD